VPDCAPKFQGPLGKLVRKSRRIRRWLPRGELCQWVAIQMIASNQGFDDIEPARGNHQIIILSLMPIRHTRNLAAQRYGTPKHRGFEAFQARNNIWVVKVSIVKRVNQCRVLRHELRICHEMGQGFLLEPSGLQEFVKRRSIRRQEDSLYFFETTLREGTNRMRRWGWDVLERKKVTDPDLLD
jgi:hypothetical protein